MKNTKFKLQGEEVQTTSNNFMKEFMPEATVSSYNISVNRGSPGNATEHTIELTDNDAVVVELENNIRWVYNRSDFVSKVQSQQPADRGSSSDELVLPLTWQDENQSRGMIGGALKLLGLKKVKNFVGEKLATAIAQKIEKNNQNELLICDKDFKLDKIFDKTTAKAGEGNYLLLIHGTASNTRGSFEGLATQNGGKTFEALYNQYPNRIISYEHKTLTQSPITNVIDLVSKLPDDITLDMMSHSRGGLVGELIARLGCAEIDKCFTAREIEILSKNEEAKSLLKEIESLHKAINKKQIKVNRFVRVACPAAGTILLSQRMDTMLNVMFNMMGRVGGEVMGTISDGLEALVTAIVNEKNDFDTLPGIECMRPTSNFIKALNHIETNIKSELIVIAGDAQGEGFWKNIKIFLLDLFYQENNDIVVNTESMSRGTNRIGGHKLFFEQRSDVDHFHYFMNPTSQKIIMEALLGSASEARGFIQKNAPQTVGEMEMVIHGSRSGKSKEGQPVLYVLPGIMGSHLEDDGDRVWLNLMRMATGEMDRIKIENKKVTANGLVAKFYKDIVNYFNGEYYVVPFAYDWRKSVYDAADKLKIDIDDTIAKTDKSITFIAHSMGGLVVRAFAVKHPQLWKKLCDRPGTRVVMLGTPLGGSFVVPRLFLGIGKTINVIATVDLAHSKKALLTQFVRYHGLLQLLPSDGSQSFEDTAIWNKMMTTAQCDYPVPASNDLSEYKKMLDKNFTEFQWNTDIFKYVAGKDDETPCRMEIDEGTNKVNFMSTPAGDGTVTWESIPEGLQASTYYFEAEHGKLAASEDAFAGIKELLQLGSTSQLSKTKPIMRGAAKISVMSPVETVTDVNEKDFADNIFGVKIQKPKVVSHQVRISITHGDMSHALYPVVVGHFENDAIVKAEKVLNQKVNNYFGIRYEANNYPGEIGTHDYVLNNNYKPPGGIVVGLGHFGTLTENNLVRTLKQGFISYLITCKEDNFYASGEKLPGISCLLIGTGFGGLNIYSAIKATLTAAKTANDFFIEAGYIDYPSIAHIEFIETYQHKAIQAGRIINSLLATNSIYNNFVFSPDIIKKVSGSRIDIPDDFQIDWWHRLKVAESEATNGNDKRTRVIKFSSITDKALSEDEVLSTNIKIVDRLIKEAAAYTNNDKALCETLYEMLIPNQFKGYGSDLRNIVLIVDKETARYPWEMLRDAFSGHNDPIVTKAGFLRQLSSTPSRVPTKLSTTNNALVIGDPPLDNFFPQLPGAKAEAKEVVNLLREKEYDVVDFTNSNPGHEIIKSLYTNSYRIWHIAAHGVVNDKTTGQTGIVLGRELILTPSDLKQVRNIPEIVFVNCCSLGTINKEEEELLQRKFEVAAGIGTQLIEMGVKAVIVAGWEVDDAAAQCFSQTFYSQLLKGKYYGESVRVAREITYTTYPSVNTWGAYQCYGDPYFTLDKSYTKKKRKTFTFVDKEEAKYMLRNVVSNIETGTSIKEEVIEETNAIIEAVNKYPLWKGDAKIMELVAIIYKELGDYKEAINWYRKLPGAEKASYSLRAVEQLFNLTTKQTYRDYNAGITAVTLANSSIIKRQAEIDNIKKQAIIEMEAYIHQFNQFNIAMTTERGSLLGSAYKNLAIITLPDATVYKKNILQASLSYKMAHEIYFNTNGKVYYYPFYNYHILNAILGILAPESKTAGKQHHKEGIAKQLMVSAEVHAAEIDAINPDFWNKTAMSMQYLYEFISEKRESHLKGLKEKIFQNHMEARKVEGSVNKQNAIGEHVVFLKKGFELATPAQVEKYFINKKIALLDLLLKELA